MKRVLLLIVIFSIATMAALGTEQEPDYVLYEGQKHDLHTNPMEPYFSKYPNKRPKGEIMCSSLWRGYVATFEVKDKTLILSDIEIMKEPKIVNKKLIEESTSVKDKIIPKGETLIIDWFSGLLVLPSGERLNYTHMGYGSTYSNYVLLEIKEGKLTGKRTYDYKQYEKFREKQFQAFKRTETYKKHVAKLQEDEWSQKQIDSFLRSYVIDYTSEFLDEEKELKPITEENINSAN